MTFDITTTGPTGFADSLNSAWTQTQLKDFIKSRLAQCGLTLTTESGTNPIKLGYSVTFNGATAFGKGYLVVEIPALVTTNCTITMRLYSAPTGSPNTYYNIGTNVEVLASGASFTRVFSNLTALIAYSIKQSDNTSYFGVVFTSGATAAYLGCIAIAYPSYLTGISESNYIQACLVDPISPDTFIQPVPNPGSGGSIHTIGFTACYGIHPITGFVSVLPSPVVVGRGGLWGIIGALDSNVAIGGTQGKLTNGTLNPWWILYVATSSDNGVLLKYA